MNNSKRKGLDLSKLADASKNLEGGSGAGGQNNPAPSTEENKDEVYTPGPPTETHVETPAVPQVELSKAFLSYMVENPKFEGQPRKSVPLAGELHNKVSKVAAAENTDIIVMVNNIVDAWLKKHAADCKKSVARANSIANSIFE